MDDLYSEDADAGDDAYNDKKGDDAYNDKNDDDDGGGGNGGDDNTFKTKVDHTMSNAPNEWSLWDWGVAGGAFLIVFLVLGCVLQAIVQLLCCNRPEDDHDRYYGRRY